MPSLENSPTESKNIFAVSKEVIALSTARFADAFGNALLFVVLPLYFDQFQLSQLPIPAEMTIGLLIGLGPLTSFLVQPFVGWIADITLRYKYITLAGLVVTGIAIFGFVGSNNVWHLAFFRGLQGVGVGMTIPTAMALVSLYSKRGNRGRSMSFFIGSRMAGLGAGPLVGGFVLVEFGFTASLILAALLVFTGFVAVTFMVKPRTRPVPGQPRHKTVSFAKILSQRGFLVIAGINVILAMSINILAPLENEVNHRLDQTAAEFGIALSLSLFANLLFQFLSGPLADRIGRKPVIILGLFILAPATISLPYAGSTEMLWMIMVLEGAATAFIGSPSYALAGDMAKEGGVGKQLSILTACFGLGLAIGPFIAGTFAGYFGYHSPFLVAGCLALVFVVVGILRIREVKEDNPAKETVPV
jgi:MFS family permease